MAHTAIILQCKFFFEFIFLNRRAANFEEGFQRMQNREDHAHFPLESPFQGLWEEDFALSLDLAPPLKYKIRFPCSLEFVIPKPYRRFCEPHLPKPA